MAQTVQILRTTTNNPPPTLLPGALSVELGTQTKLWVGAAGGNRLLMSSDPADIALSSGCVVAATPPSNPIPGLLWWDSTGGQLYVRYQDANSTAWVAAASATGSFLPISGGTLTGPLILAADPAVPLGAATKQYTDAADATKLPLAGGTLTGLLTLSGPPSANLHAATKAYVDAVLPAAGQAPALQNNVGRNLIHNPLFNIAQRGAGPFTAGGMLTADRWRTSFSGGGGASLSVTVITLTDADRTALGDEAARSCLQIASVGFNDPSGYTLIEQTTEDVRRIAGKTVTASFFGRCTAGALKIGVELYQNLGTGGSPSASVPGVGQAITLSTTWQRYSVSVTVPSISGKTLGTAGNDATTLEFWLSAGTSFNTRSGSIGVQSGTFQIWGVQLEIGSTMTPLEKPDPQQDLAKCQRFYQSPVVVSARFAAAAAGQLLDVSVSWPRMRAAPTLTGGSGTAGNVTSATLYPTTHSGGRYEITAAAAGDAYAMDASYNLSADL